MDILVYAFPVFIFLVIIEAFSLRASMSYKYRLNETISNLSCGIFDAIMNASIGTLFVGIFALSQKYFGLFTFNSSSILPWIMMFICIDLAYYIFHRASHRINLLWGAHVVHHQSEGYNLTVSLRQGTVATWITYFFYLPLAFIGFTPIMFLTTYGVYQLYQFIVHTHYLKSLGPLEYIIASPRLHRLHHAQNAHFLDKNYGGFFIIWDILFSSYITPKGKMIYGVTSGIKKWNPLWANLYYFKALYQGSQKLKKWNKLKIWFSPPERYYTKIHPKKYGYGYDAAPSNQWEKYALGQLVIAVVLAFFSLLYKNEIGIQLILISSSFVLLSLVNINGILDQSTWVLTMEIIRYCYLFVVITLMFMLGVFISLFYIVVILGIVSIIWFLAIRKEPLGELNITKKLTKPL
ncbi:MAG: sterol desaturase family protein [Nanoarchaeota archaeon]|nr:sterol desaturase family protein [Nanoarchaeota archaeon]